MTGFSYPWDWPIYSVGLAMSNHQIATCFGLAGLTDTVGRLDPELYTVRLLGSHIPVATAAVHRAGSWTLNFEDGREFSGRVGGECRS